MIFSFTGPSKLTPAEEAWCEQELLREVDADAVWRSGGAFGLDTLVAYIQAPGRVHLALPAEKPYNLVMAQEVIARGASYEYVLGSYRDRNEVLVHGSDVLHAFLRSDRFYRSGEWMTVNISRKADVCVIEHIIPSGLTEVP